MSPDPAAAAAVDPSQIAAAGRGATRIAERVVSKIAARAAREALSAGPGADVLPRGARSVPRAAVRVRHGSGHGADRGEARVWLGLELGYPSDIGAQCAAVRRRVGERVRELAGMDVPDVRVDVHRLHSAPLDGARAGRVM